MLAVSVDTSALLDLPAAIERGRAAGLRAQGEWLLATIRSNVAAGRGPDGRAWQERSGGGKALQGYESRIRVEYDANGAWSIVIDDPHASTHNFGRAKKGTSVRRRRGSRGPDVRADGSRWRASRATSREPARQILPTYPVNSGRGEPRVVMPEEWTRQLDLIMDREVQREVDALRSASPTGPA